MQRESFPVDVLIVGAGPAGLACAYHLKQLLKQKNLREIEVMVLEKAKECGAHSMSGAVMDPRGISELMPDWKEKGFPVESFCEEDGFYYLTEKGKFAAPWTPPPLRNHGKPVISLNKAVKWLAEQVENEGVTIATEMPGQELLWDSSNRVIGVQTGDKGINKKGEKKSNFEPGANVEARITVLSEGTRGSLTKTAIERLGLVGQNPQVWELGVKEVWEVAKPISAKPAVYHSFGYPLGELFGGSWIYSMSQNQISIGLVTDLNYTSPYTDPHYNFQKFKQHPWVAEMLKGGKMLGYGAKTIPAGGWFSLPQLYGDGFLILGDSAGFVNAQRLKGIHMAIKSGILAAETIADALEKDDTTSATLKTFKDKVDSSWMKEELWSVRNFHQSFEGGMKKGLLLSGLQFFTGGRGLMDNMSTHASHEHMKPWKKLGLEDRDKVIANRLKEFDGETTFDKLTDVYKSKTMHEEDQPVHLHVMDTEICRTKCREEFGNPCQFFCPANVYEMVPDEERGGVKLQINASNCVHCKTCDIMDPYEIITWVPPEGGGGPEYTNL